MTHGDLAQIQRDLGEIQGDLQEIFGNCVETLYSVHLITISKTFYLTNLHVHTLLPLSPPSLHHTALSEGESIRLGEKENIFTAYYVTRKTRTSGGKKRFLKSREIFSRGEKLFERFLHGKTLDSVAKKSLFIAHRLALPERSSSIAGPTWNGNLHDSFIQLCSACYSEKVF